MTTIPDYATPVYSFRTWRLHGKKYLRSAVRIGSHSIWKPHQAKEAICPKRRVVASANWLKFYCGSDHKPHNVPEADCTCGIYATENMSQLRHYIDASGCDFLGVVSLWGKLAYGETGVIRAEFAYPAVIFVARRRALPAERYETTYGVPAYTFPSTRAAMNNVLRDDRIPWGARILIRKHAYSLLRRSEQFQSIFQTQLNPFTYGASGSFDLEV
jgi:hypothetical protein